MVMLAVRPKEGYTTMGRETFLAKVTWENDWPVVNPGVGMLTDTVEINLPEWKPMEDTNSYTYRTNGKTCEPGSNRSYDFTSMQELGDEFLALRYSMKDKYQFTEEGLHLNFSSDTLKSMGAPAYLAIRQQHHKFVVTTKLSVKGITEQKKAGLALIQNEQYQLRVEIGDGKAEVILCEKGMDSRKSMKALSAEEVTIVLQVEDLKATIEISEADKETVMVSDLDIRSLSTEVAGGFVGCTAGIFAVTENEDAQGAVLFKALSYQSN